MTWPMVSFYLGTYVEHPEFEEFSIAPEMSDVRVKKDKNNFCRLIMGEVTYMTTELELELDSGQWYLSANFEIPDFKNVLEQFREAVANGKAELRLGNSSFLSNMDDNSHLF